MVLRSFDDSTHLNRRRFLISVIVVLAVSFAVRLSLLSHFRWENNYDSGLHGLLAQLLAAGYTPYTQVFVSYPPLFVWSLQVPWLVWGSMESLQILMVVYSLLGVAAVAFIAYRLNGWLAGLTAAVLLSFAGSYLAGSCQVMTEVPAVSMATLSMALAFGYYAGRRRPLLIVASGLAMSASLMLKILMPFMLVLIPLVIVLPRLEAKDRRLGTILKGSIADMSLLGAGLIVPVLATLLFYSPRAMYEQVISFRLDSRLAYSDEWTHNQGAVLAFLFTDNLPVTLAMIWGLVLVRKKHWDKTRLIWLWFVLSVLFAIVHVPLRLKHLPLILPPLTILAGIGLAEGWYRARRLHTPGAAPFARALTAITAILTVFYIVALGRQFVVYAGPAQPELRYQTETLVDRLQRFTSPSDCIVTDYPTLAFFAERLVPPGLSEVSSTRLESGYLPSDELIKATDASSCQVVAPVAGRLVSNSPEFVDWTREHFLAAWTYDKIEAKEVFLAQPLRDPRPAHPTDVTFGDRLRLVGYDVQPIRPTDNGGVYFSLYWQALKPVSEDYTIRLAFDDGDGAVVGADHQPFDGLVPTHLFPVDKTIKETIRVDRFPDLRKGEVQVSCGLYVADAGGSVFLTGPAGKNTIVIGTIDNP